MAYVYQAICTKYLGPTNVRGSRIKASAAAGSVIIPFNDRLNIEQAHAEAAQALAEKYGWSGVWYQGGSPDDCGYVFVCTDRVEGWSGKAFETCGPDAAYTSDQFTKA
jgi:hypothetical protein